MIKKIHFCDLKSAVEYAKANGGWIFASDDKTEIVWYNPAVYGLTQIMYDSKGSGRIDTWPYFDDVLAAI